jgi:hypothetical protein
MKRTALIAGVSAAALLCASVSGAGAAPFTQVSNGGFGLFSRQPFGPPSRRPDDRPEKKSKPDADAKPGKAAPSEADKTPAPKGFLHIVVSLDKQRATLFADGVVVTQSKVSSGTPEHPTPMGVFSILQKSRHHVSNLYDAPMPFMQRITWSGSALHEGPLPGYPASHGCVRLPNEFAQFLWKATKLGARVIITREDTAPVAIEHERLVFAKASTDDIKAAPSPLPLFTPAPQPEPATKPNTVPKVEPKPDLISEPKTPGLRDSEPVLARSAPLFKTADVSPMLRGSMPDTVKPLIAIPVRNATGEQPTKLKMSEDADDLAMPQGANTTGTTAATAVAARPVPAEAMAKAGNVKAPGTQVQVQAQPEPAPAATLPAKEYSPVVAPPPVPAAPAVAAKDPSRRKGVVSMFISLKDQRLYVRQNMEPLFDTPITIAHPGEPIGTHVYTAMGTKAAGDGLRWTVVSIPSGYKPAKPEPKVSDNGRKPRNEKPAVKTAEAVIPVPLQSPRTALDRIAIPQDAVERIATLITPGASLIVSDNKLSGETGATTDFIVETK